LYVTRPASDKEEDLSIAEMSVKSHCAVLVVKHTYPDFKAHKTDGLRIFVTRSNLIERRASAPYPGLEQNTMLRMAAKRGMVAKNAADRRW